MDDDGVVPTFVGVGSASAPEGYVDDGMEDVELHTQPPTPTEKAMPPTGFVKSLKALWSTMVKMHARNDGVIFDNSTGDFKMLVRCAYDALAAAVALCKPGVFYRDLGDTITRVAHGAGFTVVKSYCGHGVGRLFHTAPNVPHYAKNKAVGIMRAGHVFTIEPMINEGTHGDTQWPDGWTVVTRDGKRSAQFEHTLVVTDTGVELLTARAGAPRGEMVWDEAYVSRSAGEAAAVSQ